MAGTPAPASNYTTPEVTRAGTLISELNIVVPRAHKKFFNKYQYNPYMLLTQMTGGGMALSREETQNKLFYWYEKFGRELGYFTITANATGGVNTPITVTLASGSYSAGGSRSLPDIGGIFYNARTGVEFKVTAVNKSTSNAHTVTLQSVRQADNSASLAGDEFQFRGYKYVGEASDYTTTIVDNIAKYTNYVTQLRIDQKFSDLSLTEAIDFQYNGQNYYYYLAMDEMAAQFIQQKELLLFDSVLTDNLGISESGTLGLKQQVAANGITKNYSSINAQTTFADIERALDAEGSPMKYDWLMDTDQDIEMTNSLANEFPNGALVYDQDDLRRGFRKFTFLAREYNFTRYTPISERKMYGSSASGTTNNNNGYLIPQGTRVIDGNDVPQMTIRYAKVRGQEVVVSEYGALSKNGQGSKMELGIAHEGHYGLMIQGANQFLNLKRA